MVVHRASILPVMRTTLKICLKVTNSAVGATRSTGAGPALSELGGLSLSSVGDRSITVIVATPLPNSIRSGAHIKCPDFTVAIPV